MASNLRAMASNLLAIASNGLQSSSDGLQPKSDGLQPTSKSLLHLIHDHATGVLALRNTPDRSPLPLRPRCQSAKLRQQEGVRSWFNSVWIVQKHLYTTLYYIYIYISADPGRSKGERVREPGLLPLWRNRTRMSLGLWGRGTKWGSFFLSGFGVVRTKWVSFFRVLSF